MKHSCRARLVESESLDSATFVHTYEAEPIAREAVPGQFLHIRVSGMTAPLLRRPISILWSDSRLKVQVLFKVVRTGTTILAEKRIGEWVDLVGPLGTPFPYDPSRDAVLVAGGYGLAPVYFFAAYHPAQQQRRTLIYGARSQDGIYLRPRLKSVFDEILFTTEDGSLSRKGLATDALRDVLASRANLTVYACGPTPMLATVQKVIAESPDPDTPCYLSLENQMGCGVGACQGCVVQTTEGFKTTCKAGPVFDSREVIFNA
jgi:dihydroorotate dehydrogenase electron transfer subunit